MDGGRYDSREGGGRVLLGARTENNASSTTAWMHDSRDGGGRTASGTAVEEVE
jgi:hypothetical protein